MRSCRQNLMNSTIYTCDASESGRSMVEMLGVLAIIGLLSAAGVFGFSIAMNKYYANELVEGATLCSTVATTQLARGRPITEITFTGISDGAINGAEFAPQLLPIGKNKFAIQVNKVSKSLCQTLVGMSGSPFIITKADTPDTKISDSDCADDKEQNTLAFVYDSTTASGSGGGNSGGGNSGGGNSGGGNSGGGGGPSNTNCTLHSDCNGVTGYCDSSVGKCTSSQSCDDLSGCNSDSFCLNGVCVPNTSCNGTFTCLDAGMGRAAYCDYDTGVCRPLPTCESHGDCPYLSDSVCVNGQCEQTACSNYDDCPQGTYCDLGWGICKPAQGCMNDADCSNMSGYCSDRGDCVPSMTCSNSNYYDNDSCSFLENSFCNMYGICAPLPSCTGDSDCNDGYNMMVGYCDTNTGRCVPGMGCNGPDQCNSYMSNVNMGGYYYCDTELMLCKPAPTCTSNEDCTFIGYCDTYSGQCMETQSCTSNYDCSYMTGYCDKNLGGRCVQSSECYDADSSTCPNGYYCDFSNTPNVCAPLPNCSEDGECTGAGVAGYCNTDFGVCVATATCVNQTDDECSNLGNNYYCDTISSVCKPTTTCTSNNDCNGGAIYCYNGYCKNPIACYGEYGDYSDTICEMNLGSNGYYCNMGNCDETPMCSSDAECSNTAGGLGRCYNGYCKNSLSCTNDYECSNYGLSTDDYFCDVTDSTCKLIPGCSSNDDCANLMDPDTGHANYTCQGGKCQLVSCSNHSDCFNNLSNNSFCNFQFNHCDIELGCTAYGYPYECSDSSDDFSHYCEYNPNYDRGLCVAAAYGCSMDYGSICYEGYYHPGIPCTSGEDCVNAGLGSDKYFCYSQYGWRGTCSVNIPCASNSDCFSGEYFGNPDSLFCNLSLASPRCEPTNYCTTDSECVSMHGTGYRCNFDYNYCVHD